MEDLLTGVTRLAGYLSVLLMLVLAVVSVVKLRATPTGILFALGFGGSAIVGLFHRLVFSFYFRPAIDEGRYEEIEGAMTALDLLTNFTSLFLWVLIAIGAFLLASSLKPRA
ncbi:MAG: hypothetical protein H6719_21875 [Sandaracinaceae bacterium]|nr:hypothetical protein [Sandaracinaceae bacterium]